MFLVGFNVYNGEIKYGSVRLNMEWIIRYKF